MTRTPTLALLALLAAAPLDAQTQHPPRRTVAQLGTCSASGLGGPRFVIVTDGTSATDCTTGGGATTVPCWCDGSTWTVLAGGGGGSSNSFATQDAPAGTDPVADSATDTLLWLATSPVTITGDSAADSLTVACPTCSTGAHTTDTDDQTAAEVPFTPSGGIAATDVQAALEEVDAEHTVDTDTTCLDAGVSCLFAASATEGGAATSIAADTVGLAELAACAGPDEIVEYGTSGVPICIATPGGAGGSGDVVGPASSTDNAIARFDSTTGKLLQNSSLIVGDTGILSVASGGAHHLQSSAASNRLYIDDTSTRFYYTGAEIVRVGFPNVAVRSDLHLVWSSTTNPTGAPDTGIKRGAAGRADVTNGSTGTGSILFGAEIAAAAARTCADSGEGSPGTLIATVSGATYLELTGSDADGCAVTLSETGAVEGQRLEAVVVSTAGGTLNFADTAGVQETGAGCSLSLYGSALFRYTGDRWIATNCTASN